MSGVIFDPENGVRSLVQWRYYVNNRQCKHTAGFRTGEVLKQLNLQQKHEISGLYIWGSDTHISHPLDVSYGRICCIYICRPHGQPSVGTHGRICNKGNALCLSSPCPPLRSVWRADRTHSQGSRSGARTVHTCLPGAPSRVNSVEVCIE